MYYVKYVTTIFEAGFHITHRLARPHWRLVFFGKGDFDEN
jgi:hypothetical protein